MADETPSWLGHRIEPENNPNLIPCKYCGSTNLSISSDNSGKCNSCGRGFSNIDNQPSIDPSSLPKTEIREWKENEKPKPNPKYDAGADWKKWLTISIMGLIIMSIIYFIAYSVMLNSAQQELTDFIHENNNMSLNDYLLELQEIQNRIDTWDNIAFIFELLDIIFGLSFIVSLVMYYKHG